MKRFFENVCGQILLLLILSIVTVVGLHFGHRYLEARQSYLNELVVNEQTKVEISHLLQNKLLAINTGLQDLTHANSQTEIVQVTTRLKSLQEQILSFLHVIEVGGTADETYPVNYSGEESVRRQLHYVNYAPGRINIEALELRAKMAELTEMVQKFRQLAEHRVVIMEFRDPMMTADTIRRVSFQYKGIRPFFTRIVENANRLHFTSQKEAQRLQDYNLQFSETYRRVELLSIVASLSALITMGSVILYRSRRIFLERQRYQQQLSEINENLETIVQSRTRQLQQEVTERRKTEQQLSEQARFLTTTLESLDHPFLVINTSDSTVVMANSAARRQCRNWDHPTCYARTHCLKDGCSEKDHPCTLERIKAEQQAVIIEYVHQNAQDETVYVEVHGYPIFNGDGELVQIIEYSLDVTERKRAQQQLLAAKDHLELRVEERTHELKKAQKILASRERHFRRLIENVTDIITIVDADGIVAYTSPAAEKLFGRPVAEMIGHDIREFVVQDDLRQVDLPTLHQQFGTTTPVEYRVYDHAGQVQVLESFIERFEDENGQEQYILCSRLITQRKKAEEENRILSMVVAQNPSSIVITDVHGHIEYVNPYFEQATGYRFDEVVGKNPRILNAGKTPKQVYAEMWQTVLDGRVWQGEFINCKKNGDLYDENVLVSPIKNDQGEITHFVALKENITELKKARKLAEEANRAKSDFLSRMSHELRTPLNAINGFAELMLSSRKNPLGDKHRSMVSQIDRAGKHLLDLINEVLDLSRIEAGKLSLSIEAVDPCRIVEECLPLLHSLGEAHQVTFHSRCCDHDFPSVMADYTRIKQVLVNLLSNAAKYNRPGGDVTIDVLLNEPPGFLCFRVADNGLGIAEEKQKELFVPFARLSTNADSVEGTGIGMTITKQLVEAMGGAIGFESRLGEGSTFWFTLPLAEPHAERKERYTQGGTMTTQPPLDASKPLVLYVEDNPGNLSLMTSFFDEWEGADLLCCPDGETGLEQARLVLPAVILLDLNLPGIDGFEVFERLRRQPETAHIPIIAVSADAMKETLRRAGKLGFDGFLSKPVDFEQLQFLLEDLLEKGR
nr:PAS domain S-box protein [uncultured Desulfuromonas sp.]